MIYEIPALNEHDRLVIAKIDGLRDKLRHQLSSPGGWLGTLRRTVVARSIRGSNSIEGYHATVEQIRDVMHNNEPEDLDVPTRQAIEGYRDAMTYVLRRDPSEHALDVTLLKALHFMMMKHELHKHPGDWRPGAVWVEDELGAEVYRAPARAEVDALVSETVTQVREADGPPMVVAAMAHLNLALIHPFSDGNGRMARCVQTLVLAREGVVAPEFCSVEEYLGRNTTSYYRALTQVAEGVWSPERSAHSWVEFCLRAHYQQAITTLRRMNEVAELWVACEGLAVKHGLPERCVDGLVELAYGRRLRRPDYISVVQSATGEAMSGPTATRDLTAITNAGLSEPQGERRGRSYVGSTELILLWQDIRSRRVKEADITPYDDLRNPQLPGL